MTEHFIIPSISRRHLPNDVFDTIADLCRLPAGMPSIRVELARDDPRADQIFRLLNNAGFTAKTSPFGMINREHEYPLTIFREYTPVEIASFEYLRLIPTITCETFDPVPGEQWPALSRSDLPTPAKGIARSDSSALIVSQPAREALEHARIGLQFTSLTLLDRSGGKPIPWEKYGSPWWRPTSDLRLPPLSPSMKRVDYRGNPLPYGHEGVLNIDHGIHMPLELSYRRSDLEGLHPFDYAETFERFAWVRHHPIVSQRFREIVEEHNFPVEWAPVRIEEDL